MPKTKSSFGKNTALMAVSKFSAQFASLIVIPIYTRLIDPADYGFVDLALTYVGILAPLIALSFDMGIFRFLIDARGNRQSITAVISSAFKLLLPLLSSLAIVSIVINYFIGIRFGWLIIINAIVAIIAGVVSQIMRGLGNNKDFTISSILSALLMIIVAAFTVIWLDLGAAGILAAAIASSTVTLFYSFIRLKLHRYIVWRTANRQLQRKLLKYSLPLIPEGVLWWIMQASDRTIISIVLGLAANGIYAVANRIGAIVNGFVSILWMSWTQSSAEEIDSPHAANFFSKIGNEYYIRLLGSICILLIPTVSLLFDLLIGQEYIEAYQYVPGIVVAAFGSGLLGFVAAIYNAKKMTKELAATTIVPAIINLITNITLINFIGLWAAVLSTIISYYVMFIWRYLSIKKIINIQFKPKDLVITSAVFTTVSALYYWNNPLGNAVSLLIAISASLALNSTLLKQGFHLLFSSSHK